jgi:hypothetical protein
MKKTSFLLAIALVAYFSSVAQWNTAEYLDINKVKARYMVHGDMFWDPVAQTASYEFPKGSGIHSGFASSFWVGGINQATQNLHLAAQTYRIAGNDYYPGPLDIFNGATSNMNTAANWNQIWKVNKSTIDSFRMLSVHTVANTPVSILYWPGRRSTYAKTPNNLPLSIPDREMAPFVDVNSDNQYNPLDGDYPDIKGEQMLWWVFNDNTAAHTQSGGLPLKIEIHASAYACNQTGLENTTFLNYKLNNFSSTIYDNAVITFWNDMDLGYAYDDFIGFDSVRRMGIVYNGDGYDETTFGYSFGLTQKAAVIIQQPDDLPNYRSPVGSFTYYTSGLGQAGDPSATAEYYNYMTGKWRGGQPFRKGCNTADTSQAISQYAFPDDPSIVGGISEVQCANVPDDRRFLLSSHPFTLLPGAVPLEFTFAFVNTDTGVNNANFNELRRLTDSAYKYENGCASNAWPLAVSDLGQSNFSIYPNPTADYFIAEDLDEQVKKINLYNTTGQVVYKTISKKVKTRIDTGQLPKGVYYIKIKKGKKQFSQSVVIE